MMKVFKFGGASIKDVENIKNIASILTHYNEDNLFIVFSAMGKVTNMLEEVVEAYVLNNDKATLTLNRVKDFHQEIMEHLFDAKHPIYDIVNNLFVEIEWVLEEAPNQQYAYDYDQIVAIGELLSTQIMSAYLLQVGFENTWLDARDLIRTDNTYRNAKIDWNTTVDALRKVKKSKHNITQGFIGCTSENFTTTLGREGSDFSAAILAFGLDADEVVIWKDVPGLMNADPKYFPKAVLLDKLSFDEAIELAFYGAKVIHPKTIQPLKKKAIPLRVRSFIDLDQQGTLVKEGLDTTPFIPSFIVKENQILISIADKNLDFIVEKHMSHIFSILSEYNVEVNLMQHSAVSFSICVDNDKYKIPRLIQNLQEYFNVFYNQGLNLFTIRGYTQNSIKEFLSEKQIILEQRSRHTLQLIA